MDRQNVSFKMGQRLRDLREVRGLSHVDLMKQLSDKYGIAISRDSLMAYEIADESRAKASKLPNLGMRVEYLYCLADFFGVSTDYLLGKTEIATSNIDTRNAFEYMGLSQEAGEMVLKIKEAPNTAANPVIRRLNWVLNEVIQEPSFFFVLRDLSRILDYYSDICEHFTDDYPDGFWHDVGGASISERDILETIIQQVEGDLRSLIDGILDNVETGKFAKIKEMFPYCLHQDKQL